MKLRQFWEEDAEEGAGVDQEMCGVVLCVETGKNIPAKRTPVSFNESVHEEELESTESRPHSVIY